MTPEQLAAIKARAGRARRYDIPVMRQLGHDADTLLAEVERLQTKDENALRWEGHLAEKLLLAQNALHDAAAEIERLRSENAALKTPTVKDDELNAWMCEEMRTPCDGCTCCSRWECSSGFPPGFEDDACNHEHCACWAG